MNIILSTKSCLGVSTLTVHYFHNEREIIKVSFLYLLWFEKFTYIYFCFLCPQKSYMKFVTLKFEVKYVFRAPPPSTKWNPKWASLPPPSTAWPQTPPWNFVFRDCYRVKGSCAWGAESHILTVRVCSKVKGLLQDTKPGSGRWASDPLPLGLWVGGIFKEEEQRGLN